MWSAMSMMLDRWHMHVELIGFPCQNSLRKKRGKVKIPNPTRNKQKSLKYRMSSMNPQSMKFWCRMDYSFLSTSSKNALLQEFALVMNCHKNPIV
ncbi:hypothetical protein EYC84_002453 [Monilinia fructicola]|uniref:Uncharacterized protein n=1 Tax=Monilinia fructicola TaxID=38448 RepID=A0A5M9JLG8_MONFR|nr:hypothetical protein EYC84_002453 [Monilinia fructicola]